MRRLLVALVLLAACSGGKDSTGPTPVASVALSPATAPINIGQTTTLTASALDASGAVLTGRTVTWTSSATNIATVVNGVVTGVAAGQASITATIESKSSQTTITVLAAATGCAGVTPLSVAVGEIHTFSATERQQLCLAGGAAGSEYVLIPFNTATTSSSGAAAAVVPLSVSSTNTVAASGPPTSTASASIAAFAAAAPATLSAEFERRIAQSVQLELSPAMRARSRLRAAFLQRTMSRIPDTFSAIRGLAATPAVGAAVQLNTNGTQGCTNAVMHGGRVAAVSTQAIVVVDSGAPAGGFTDTEYAGFAATFDTLVYALDTTAFGKPFDMDNNGRVVLFFTQAVNQLTPASSSTGFIGGFFHPRDLFPQVANAVVPFSCPGSNEGEMFYLPVVDANSQFNGFFKDKTRLTPSTIQTLAHEFQHLINASRRIYVTPQDVDFMETWLNEAMSHTAEELLYYRAAGLGPKTDLTRAVVTGTQARVDAINNYQIDNLSRLISYLKAPDANSAYNTADVLATRGASWELLRYALDLSTSSSNANLHAMIDSPVSVLNPTGGSEVNGLGIFNAIFSNTFVGGLIGAVRQQVIAQFFDNTTISMPSQYAFPSWNFRDVIPAITSNGVAVFLYSSLSKSLVSGVPITFSLVGGGTGYGRFHVNGGAAAVITPTSAGGAVPTSVELILIRTQ